MIRNSLITYRLLLLPLMAGMATTLSYADEAVEPVENEIRTRVLEASEIAREWADKVREWKGGDVKTTYMGVVIESVPSVLRDYVDLPKGVGLLLPRIAADGPADKAGLEDNDILVKFDGQWVINYSQLSTLIELKGPGATVPVSILRKGEEMEFEVTLEEKARTGAHFIIPHAPDAPQLPGVPDTEELGAMMQQIEEWIPGSVRVYIDKDEQVHVDLQDLKDDLQGLRTKFKMIHVLDDKDAPEMVIEHGDMGARQTTVHIADRNINYKSDEGKVVLNSSDEGKHVMVWDAEDNLIYDGELPEDYEAALPEKAVKLINSLEQLNLDTKECIEIELINSEADPVTMLMHQG